MFESITKLKSRIETLESALKSMTGERDNYKTKLSDADRLKEQEIKAIRFEHDLVVKGLKADHELALKTKQFEIDHNDSEALKTSKKELTDALTKLAVAESKLELMSKVTDVNADVLDVKDLVTKLIDKMPNINIDGIIAGLAGGGAKKTEGK